jgi:hypothetical protein
LVQLRDLLLLVLSSECHSDHGVFWGFVGFDDVLKLIVFFKQVSIFDNFLIEFGNEFIVLDFEEIEFLFDFIDF